MVVDREGSTLEAQVIDTVDIAGRRVGHDEPSFVMAEIGINHNGDLGLARS